METAEHMLLFCKNAKLTWRIAPLQWDGLNGMRINIVRWWEGLIEAKRRDMGQEHVTLIVNIMWQIWKARNRKVFSEDKVDAGLMIQKEQMEWIEFIKAQNSGGGDYIEQTNHSTTFEHWKPLGRGVVKINIDAAFAKGMDRSGLGIVARDWKGRTMKAWAKI
ncbi:uncharacterized protein [Coffea arabica]|uniref:Uncharacterized protein n=1 Tax=Coffea arabica TaxID=13443 RepID=A0ABM4W315_COFAR